MEKMSLPNEVINHMDIDDLRNYVYSLENLESYASERIFAGDELIEILQRAYNTLLYKENATQRYTACQGRIRKIERELEEKYNDFMPKPVCAENAKEATYEAKIE